MINVSIDNISCIVTATYGGTISIKEIEEFYCDLLQRTELPVNLRIMQDERVCVFKDTKNTIKSILQILPKLVERFITVRIAILQTKTLQTAYSNLFIGEIKTKNVAVSVFYTKEAALGWL